MTLLPLYLQRTLLENTTTAHHPLFIHLSQCAARSGSPRCASDPGLPACLPRLPPLPSFLFQILFHVYERSACVCVRVPYSSLVPTDPLRGHPFPRTGVIDNCESPCGRWEVNLGPNTCEANTTAAALDSLIAILCPPTIKLTHTKSRHCTKCCAPRDHRLGLRVRPCRRQSSVGSLKPLRNCHVGC